MRNSHFDFINTESKNRGIHNAVCLLYISSAKYGGDWHSTPHTHSCSELFFVIGGLGQFRIENQIYPVESNQLIIVNPHVEHTEISLQSNPLQYIVLGVEGLELSVSEEQDSRFCMVHFSNVREIILGYLQNMLREIDEKKTGYEIVCQNLLEILVLLLMRQTKSITTLAPVHRNTSRLCASVHRYIGSHYKENVNLDTLAEMVHVSKYHMVHAFTEEYGISPISHLNACRIKESRQLLETTDYSLSTISRLLGFSSPSYFSQSFRRAEGISPTEYRKRMREELSLAKQPHSIHGI
ncbi:MAG: helix-turn-helix transcriptional regulator [Lachnospiraceae bacterium]|nr:helix-turn-helix transcriptional regulator [Lachnospiraceae bacterium]